MGQSKHLPGPDSRSFSIEDFGWATDEDVVYASGLRMRSGKGGVVDEVVGIEHL